MPRATLPHILITAGPTVEDLDPVRFISNRATGKLGVATARAALRRGAQVTLIHGPIVHEVLSKLPRSRRLTRVSVRSAAEMHQAVMRAVRSADVVIMNAAVADFTPAKVLTTKLKKADAGLVIRLKPTVDILKELGTYKRRQPALKLIGFALESGSGRTARQRRAAQLSEAQRKLESKNADAIVLDTPHAMGAEQAHFTLLRRTGEVRDVELHKEAFADELIKLAVELYQGG